MTCTATDSIVRGLVLQSFTMQQSGFGAAVAAELQCLASEIRGGAYFWTGNRVANRLNALAFQMAPSRAPEGRWAGVLDTLHDLANAETSLWPTDALPQDPDAWKALAFRMIEIAQQTLALVEGGMSTLAQNEMQFGTVCLTCTTPCCRCSAGEESRQ